MSAPAMKLRPAPISTMAFTSGSASPFSIASRMPSRTPGASALTGGLSITMIPMPSSTSKRTSGLSPCPSPPMAYLPTVVARADHSFCNSEDFRRRQQDPTRSHAGRDGGQGAPQRGALLSRLPWAAGAGPCGTAGSAGSPYSPRLDADPERDSHDHPNYADEPHRYPPGGPQPARARP